MDSETPIDAVQGNGDSSDTAPVTQSESEPLLEAKDIPVLKTQRNNPLHGVTLEQILNYLVENYGWIEMNRRVEINCFFSNPSVKSSLNFLRKNNWARIKVERMYLEAVSGTDVKNRDRHE